MQSNKSSSRKPRETAADTAGALPEADAAVPVKKARKTTAASGSKAPKKEASKDAVPAKRHRKTAAAGDTAVSPLESPTTALAGEAPAPLRAMAAASGAGTGSFQSDVVESAGNMTEPRAMGGANAPANEAVLNAGVNREEIAALAHSYWAARGYQHGSHEEDWLRAERELKSRRR